MRSTLATAMMTAGLLLFPASSLLASDKQGPEVRYGKWADALELTEEQRSELKGVRKAHQRALAEVEDRSGRRALKREQHQEMRSTLQMLLTDEQREVAHARMHERKEARFERMASRLELTEAQQPIVREVLRDAMAEARDLMRAARIQAQAEGQDRGALRTQLQEARGSLKEQTRERLAGVLSSDQLAKLDAMLAQQRRQDRGERRGHGYSRDDA